MTWRNKKTGATVGATCGVMVHTVTGRSKDDGSDETDRELWDAISDELPMSIPRLRRLIAEKAPDFEEVPGTINDPIVHADDFSRMRRRLLAKLCRERALTAAGDAGQWEATQEMCRKRGRINEATRAQMEAARFVRLENWCLYMALAIESNQPLTYFRRLGEETYES